MQHTFHLQTLLEYFGERVFLVRLLEKGCFKRDDLVRSNATIYSDSLGNGYFCSHSCYIVIGVITWYIDNAENLRVMILWPVWKSYCVRKSNTWNLCCFNNGFNSLGVMINAINNNGIFFSACQKKFSVVVDQCQVSCLEPSILCEAD
jgi:hypothetical protein